MIRSPHLIERAEWVKFALVAFMAAAVLAVGRQDL